MSKRELRKNCLNCGKFIYAQCKAKFNRTKFCSRSCITKYYPNPMLGKKHSEKTKALFRKQRKNRDFSYLNTIENMKKRMKSYGQTKLEKKLEDWLKEANLDYKYTGDGEVFLGRCCPDYMDTNGKKILIELSPYSKRTSNKIKFYKTLGFETILIQNRLVRINHKKFVIDKIRKIEGDLYPEGISCVYK